MGARNELAAPAGTASKGPAEAAAWQAASMEVTKSSVGSSDGPAAAAYSLAHMTKCAEMNASSLCQTTAWRVRGVVRSLVCTPCVRARSLWVEVSLRVFNTRLRAARVAVGANAH